MIFNDSTFKVFEELTLEGRMSSINDQIRPLFCHYGKLMANILENLTQKEVNIHIAKHLRRTTYPPESTWVAIGGDKRGYKKYPHFQIGINAEYVFIVLALIDNPLYEKEIVSAWLDNINQFEHLPDDFIIIPDHTRLEFFSKNEIDFVKMLNRVNEVKKAEIMIGRVLLKTNPILKDEQKLVECIIQTVELLFDLYQESMKFYE